MSLKCRSLGICSAGGTGDGLLITGNTNATPIVISGLPADHGLQDGDRIAQSGVAGNTAANGIWTLSAVTATGATLVGSVGNGTTGAATDVCIVNDKTPFMRGHDAVVLLSDAVDLIALDGTVIVKGSDLADATWQDGSVTYTDAVDDNGYVVLPVPGASQDGIRCMLRNVKLFRYMKLSISAWTAGGVAGWLLS